MQPSRRASFSASSDQLRYFGSLTWGTGEVDWRAKTSRVTRPSAIAPSPTDFANARRDHRTDHRVVRHGAVLYHRSPPRRRSHHSPARHAHERQHPPRASASGSRGLGHGGPARPAPEPRSPVDRRRHRSTNSPPVRATTSCNPSPGPAPRPVASGVTANVGSPLADVGDCARSTRQRRSADTRASTAPERARGTSRPHPYAARRRLASTCEFAVPASRSSSARLRALMCAAMSSPLAADPS